MHYNPNNNEAGHKTDELAFMATWGPTTVKLAGPVLVTRSGNMAVTVAQLLYTQTQNGKVMNRPVQHMMAWTLVDGKWQMAVVQSKGVSG